MGSGEGCVRKCTCDDGCDGDEGETGRPMKDL